VKSAEDGGKNTSKYFSNKPPADILKPVAKTTPAKPSPQRGKRLSSSFLEESDEDEINVPSPKIPRASNKGHHASGSTPNGAIKDSKDNVVSGGKGRGRGRAGTSSSLDEDFDEASSGVGRGRGKGKGAIAMTSTTTDAEPKQPVSRGRGSGESPSKQADTKAAPSGRGRGGGGGGGFYIPARVPPPHKGEKELPEGAEDALAGLTFVISGTLDSLEREEAEHLIKCHGGRVTTSVSKKTDYLLADEDIGGRKSQKAKELGVKFLTEDGLFNMIRKSKKSSSSASKAPPPPPQKAPAEGSYTLHMSCNFQSLFVAYVLEHDGYNP
jgi:replication factor C subunit 1